MQANLEMWFKNPLKSVNLEEIKTRDVLVEQSLFIIDHYTSNRFNIQFDKIYHLTCLVQFIFRNNAENKILQKISLKLP